MVGDEGAGGQGMAAAPVFEGSAELGAAYEECEAEVRRSVPRLWTLIGTLLPVEVRPFVHAIAGWVVRTDRTAAEGRPRNASVDSPIGRPTPWPIRGPGTAWIRYGGRSWTPCAAGISTGR